MKTIFIKPSCDKTRQGEWKFSVLDRSCLGMVIKGAWIFPYRLDEEALVKSFSVLLGFYPYLAGRVAKGEKIVPSGEGIPFTVCEDSGLTTAEAARIPDAVNGFASPLKLSSFKKGACPPLSLRLTHLSDGSVLSVQAAHGCMDGSSFYTMMNNWAALCRGEEIRPPVTGGTVFVPHEGASKEALVQRAANRGWYRLGWKDLFRGFGAGLGIVSVYRSRPLFFPEEKLVELQRRFNSVHGTDFGRGTLLAAVIAKMSLVAAKPEHAERCSQITVADLRGRLPGLPAEWVGNAVCNLSTDVFNSGDTLYTIAGKIGGKIREMFSEGARELEDFMELYIDCIGYRIPFLPFDLKGMTNRRPTAIYINNFLKFDIYGVDFGAGRPVAALPPDLPDQVRIWPASPDRGGAEVYFTGRLARIIDGLPDPDSLLDTILGPYGVTA